MFPHFKKKKRRKKSAPKAPWGGAAGAGRRRRRRRGSAGGAGNNDAVIKTSLWPRVHVFAELGRVRLAHRERARLSSTRPPASPAATRAVPLWAAGSPARAPRAGSVGLGEGDFAEASRSEPTKKRKIFPRHRAPRGPGWACTGTEESPVAAGAWLEMGRRRRAARSRPPSAGSRLLARPVLGGGADWQAHWWARWRGQFKSQW